MNPSNRKPHDASAASEMLYQGRWLSLRRRGHWEYAERNNPGGAVIILAVTPDDNILFVEQYRVAVQKFTIEMPAGLVGDLAGSESENIVVHEVPRKDAAAWLLARSADGYSIDPKLFAGLWFIEHAELFD